MYQYTSTVARVVQLVRQHRATRGGGAKIVLFKKVIPLVNYSFLCMLEFWQRLLSMFDKLESHCKVRAYPLAQQLGCLEVKK